MSEVEWRRQVAILASCIQDFRLTLSVVEIGSSLQIYLGATMANPKRLHSAKFHQARDLVREKIFEDGHPFLNFTCK